MLTVNLGIQDCPVNGQTQNIFSHIKFAESSVLKVCAKFSDEQAGLKARDHLI